ncbi:MAG: cation:proton antiporter regulatory subunit [Microbacterium sp.]|uniref:cation:proton antiporter regulatory subunit n=1 Tax=Microbacterium sp. TaxID=51671 RepID=UPI00092A2419|nr:cation:proton antiporter regulatory subunit [Microbacterium sp.]OJU74064.1 MAG: potassium transporter TrkA [Microbacterium sp. 71-23]MBN9155417.1 cation:proton antiporter regulatory subunit [Microbacterium sp.]MBN9168368.1 cation:proton antiporter regulatory subunit [Microbacterium sp.]MBN9173581.1 cation:proton antiporter regulatory subunit [Microbacterium sp.]MBN9179876.1 cation:proton antiporter regulatory subunit [Microbacterium sp.]
MTIRIEKVDLPGIGVRHDLVTENGRRLGVVSYRDGDRELTISDADDPDACAYALPINEDEAEALADLFGASVAISRLTKLTDETDGLYTEKIELPADSPFVGRTLGDTKTRTRTHVSVVAIIRDRKVIPSPTPSQTLREGDVIVTVGTREGLDAAARLIADGPD